MAHLFVRQEGGTDWRRQLETQFGGALRRYFYRRVHSVEDACDLTQELFVRILGREAACDAIQPDAYIFRAASNLLHENSRRAVVRGSQIAGAVDTDIFGSWYSGIDEITPERILASKDALKKVDSALNMLNPITRAVFILHRVEKMKHKQIASQLGISVSAVEKHVAKALVHLVRNTEA